MGCGVSSQSSGPTLSPDELNNKQKLMRMVSKGESIEEKIEGNVAAANQAGCAVSAVSEEFAAVAFLAEKGIETLLGTAEELPLLGGIFRLLNKCWHAAKEIKKTERAVEKLMHTAAGLVDLFDEAKSALTGYEDGVKPLENVLTAVAKFFDERVKEGSVMNALTPERANETMNGLNEDLKVAMQAISCSIGLAVHRQGQRVEDKVDKGQRVLDSVDGNVDTLLRGQAELHLGQAELHKLVALSQPVVGKSSDADSIYAYIAVQRPPVITGQAISLNSINVCLDGMREALEQENEASEWQRTGCFPVSLNDGGRACMSVSYNWFPAECTASAHLPLVLHDYTPAPPSKSSNHVKHYPFNNEVVLFIMNSTQWVSGARTSAEKGEGARARVVRSRVRLGDAGQHPAAIYRCALRLVQGTQRIQSRQAPNVCYPMLQARCEERRRPPRRGRGSNGAVAASRRDKRGWREDLFGGASTCPGGDSCAAI